MRGWWLPLFAIIVALGGCRSDEELTPPDLSAASLYCPPAPPADGTYVCDPTSIPYCTYPTQGMTCHCVKGSDGTFTLTCGPEEQPDAGI